MDYHPRISFQQCSEPPPGPLSSHPTNTPRTSPSSSNQITPPKSTSRRQSFIRQTDLSARPIAENARDSISSNGSWMRRLSIRPLSQHGSPRSSIGPDSPSLVYSYGSGAPVLSPTGSAPPQMPPNKLIKRASSGQNHDSGAVVGRGSRSQVPSFRRPATSHQRSATLQQFQQQDGFSGPPAGPKYSLDHRSRPRAFTTKAEVERTDSQSDGSRWASFFHFRVTRASRGSSGSPGGVSLPNKRIQSSQRDMPRACLVKAAMIAGAAIPQEQSPGAESQAENHDGRRTTHDSPDSAEDTPSKRARRSISMQFSSPSNWISKTGSIRRPKRGSTEAKSEGKRHVSAPTTTAQNLVQPELLKPTVDEIFISHEPRLQLGSEGASDYHPKARKRNSSSPLPQISRLSSFNIDVSHLGTSVAPASGHSRANQVSITFFSTPQTNPSPAQSRGVSGECTSTMASSDVETRDCTSGDDDDTDFKSDVVFDSFRTAGSNRLRNVDTPLESMFDESPPSTAGNSKTKRLSIQEILGQSWDSDTRIMEEDESAPTPIRAIHSEARMGLNDGTGNLEGLFRPGRALARLSLSNRDFSRLSLDDDDDDDWARDEENGLSNHLFPPSSSLNSRRASPRLRHALVSITGNSSLDSRHHITVNERPRSNIFDWTEPPLHEKFDVDGHSPRPKTVHGKQEMDLRGGRPANRKGPGAGHVRSQSVPVVPEPSEGSSKAVPKFGTWGLGTKPVSEDWDDDFDFDEDAVSPVGGKDSATSFSMIVPASIQATQPTVKAHSGQIRELSLLVNDLKRLCRHGKDLDILDGPCSSKWMEAQNIIELASPDEDEDEGVDADGHAKDSDCATIDERFLEEGFDAGSLDRTEDPFLIPESIAEPEMAKNAVVRERQTTRRRSVFSPEDDIFGGNWPLNDEKPLAAPPRTPDQSTNSSRKSAMISTVMEAMQQQQRSTSDLVKRRSPVKPSQSKLFFDTNSLQELVKKAGQLRDSLSDVVRRAELLTQSPAGTPRRERVPRLGDGSPAFTRVFTDPASSPPKRLPKSHSTNSVLSRTSVDSPRLQMMTVN